MQHTLVSKNFNFTQQNTRGGVTLTRNINPAPLFQLGAIGKAEIKFTVVDLSMTLLESKLLFPLQFKNGSYWFLSNGDKAAIRDNSGNINLQGEEITYTKNGTQIGKFIVYKAEKRTDTLVDVYAYDRLCLFDKKADDWWNNLKFPLTVPALLQSLCAYVGVSCRMGNALNLTMQVQKTIQVENTPCSDFLSWICEATGTFAICDSSGTVVLDFYRQTNKFLKALTGNEKTTEEREQISVITPYEVSGEKIDAIDKLQIKSRENDIGKIVGDGTNAYVIEQNPLFFGMTDAQLTPPAQALYGRVKNVAYTNFNVSYYNRKAPDIRLGDIFVFHTRRGNVTCYAQQQQDNGEKSTLQSAGKKSRIQVRSINKTIQQLQGKSNEIIATVEKFSITLTDLEKGVSSLSVTVDGIKTSVSDINGNVSKLELTAKGLQTSVTNVQGDVSSLKLTTSGLTAAVNAVKLTFDATGLTIKNGGFRIQDAIGNNTFTVQNDGRCSMIGDVTAKSINLVSGYANYASLYLGMVGSKTTPIFNINNASGTSSIFQVYNADDGTPRLFLNDDYGRGIFHVYPAPDGSALMQLFQQSGSAYPPTIQIGVKGQNAYISTFNTGANHIKVNTGIKAWSFFIGSGDEPVQGRQFWADSSGNGHLETHFLEAKQIILDGRNMYIDSSGYLRA